MAGLDKILDDIRAEGAKAVESVKSAAQAAYVLRLKIGTDLVGDGRRSCRRRSFRQMT